MAIQPLAKNFASLLYFRMNPTVSLGELEDAVIAMHGLSVISIDGGGVVPFVASLVQSLRQVREVTLGDLALHTGVTPESLLPVLRMLVKAKILVSSNRPSSSKVSLAIQRSGEQVDSNDIERRIKNDMVGVVTNQEVRYAKFLIGLLQDQGLRVDMLGERDKESKPVVRIVAFAGQCSCCAKKHGGNIGQLACLGEETVDFWNADGPLSFRFFCYSR